MDRSGSGDGNLARLPAGRGMVTLFYMYRQGEIEG